MTPPNTELKSAEEWLEANNTAYFPDKPQIPLQLILEIQHNAMLHAAAVVESESETYSPLGIARKATQSCKQAILTRANALLTNNSPMEK